MIGQSAACVPGAALRRARGGVLLGRLAACHGRRRRQRVLGSRETLFLVCFLFFSFLFFLFISFMLLI
jgi:hypothetical protein